MPAEKHPGTGAQVELRLGEYHVHGGSISSGPQGMLFACTIDPLSDETIAALGGAVEHHRRIRLLLPRPLLLDLVSLERKEPRSVRIVGRIIDLTKAGD
jgi:hypothetical protein